MQTIGTNDQNNSEVALIRQQMEAEYEAARLAMYGYAEVAKHEIITAKYDRLGGLLERLEDSVGKDNAMKTLIEVMDREPQ